MDICTNYEFDPLHIVIPTSHIFVKICSERDKTKLFVVTVLRLLVYYLIFTSTIFNKTVSRIQNLFNHDLYINWIMYSIILLTVISMVLVVAKKVIYPKGQDITDANIIAEEEKLPSVNTNKEERSLGRTEAVKIALPEVITPQKYIDRSIS